VTQGYIASAGLPLPLVGHLAAIAIEIGGGTLLVIGFQARPVAIVMAIFCVATVVGFHHDFTDQNQLIHFLKNIAMAGGLLQIVAFGAGALSIDAVTPQVRRYYRRGSAQSQISAGGVTRKVRSNAMRLSSVRLASHAQEDRFRFG
jgi:putative oxidoreductase